MLLWFDFASFRKGRTELKRDNMMELELLVYSLCFETGYMIDVGTRTSFLGEKWSFNPNRIPSAGKFLGL